MQKIMLPLCCLLLGFLAAAQNIPPPGVEVLTSGTKSSLRGLSVVNDNVVWVSGSKGVVGKSSNGGRTWKWLTVKGFEDKEFRDIEAFDGMTAVIMAVGEPAYILKTTDGGESWKVVYENKDKGMFLDAMEFWNDQYGVVIGDPLDGRFFMTVTTDAGNTWKDIPLEKRPLADSGEACFAASGTNIRALSPDEFVFVSGGRSSKVHFRDKAVVLPLVQGTESTGANSVSVYNYAKKGTNKNMVVVGGDFSADSSRTRNCFYSKDGGKTWEAPKVPPHGYRSCVEYLSKKDLVSCGLNGIDYSDNGGKTWQWISRESFHTVRIAKLGRQVYLCGNNGKVGRLVF
jgi:photosystem II stability/assembly factor-like uncharacterized protein